MKKLIKLPSMSRVVAGAKAVLELPIGPTYERIVFVVTAAAGFDAGDIGRIDVNIDAKTVQTYKNLQRLIDLNSYWNREADPVAATGGNFAIHFNRAEMEGNIFRRAPGIGTADVQTFTVEMDIASGAPADIAITAYAQINPDKQPLGAFFRVRELAFSSAVSGQVEIDKLVRGPYYGAIHLFKSDVSAVEVTANDVKIVDASKTVLERFQKGASPKVRVPVTGSATHIDFMLDGDVLDTLPTGGLSDFRVKPTITTSGSIDVVTETVDTL